MLVCIYIVYRGFTAGFVPGQTAHGRRNQHSARDDPSTRDDGTRQEGRLGKVGDDMHYHHLTTVCLPSLDVMKRTIIKETLPIAKTF